MSTSLLLSQIAVAAAVCTQPQFVALLRTETAVSLILNHASAFRPALRLVTNSPMFSDSAQSGRASLVLLLLITTIATADQNPLVSEGICYYAAGKQADSVYIPCGNDAFGVYACCMNGDNCLSSNACYNDQYDDTYIAGCTDPTYTDGSCGNKGAYGDLEWASLVRCFVSNDPSTDDEEWAACYESNQPVVTQHDGGCVCTSPSQYVFKDNPTLTNFAVLPAATGQSIRFEPGYTPPSDLTPTAQATSSSSADVTSTSSSASKSSSSSSSTSTSAAATSSSSSSSESAVASSTSSSSSSFSSTSTSSSSSTSTSNTSLSSASSSSSSSSSSSTPVAATTHGNLSTAAEAGIGVGVGLGVLFVCAVLFLLYRRRVKKRYMDHDNIPQASFISPYTDSNTGWSSQNQSAYTHENGAGAGAAAETLSPIWLGRSPAEERSALMGSRPISELASKSNVSEVDGSSSATWISRGSSSRYSNPNFTPVGNDSSNESTMRGSWMQSHPHSRLNQEMQTVHELPGSNM